MTSSISRMQRTRDSRDYDITSYKL